MKDSLDAKAHQGQVVGWEVESAMEGNQQVSSATQRAQAGEKKPAGGWASTWSSTWTSSRMLRLVSHVCLAIAVVLALVIAVELSKLPSWTMPETWWGVSLTTLAGLGWLMEIAANRMQSSRPTQD